MPATEWKFPPPMILAWKSPKFMPSLTRPPVFTFGDVTKPTKKRRVSFGTATTYIFPVAFGGSAIPRDQGPPIGLATTHTRIESHSLLETQIGRHAQGRVRRFDTAERIALLQGAGFSPKKVTEMCVEAIAVRRSRDNSLATDDERDDHDNRRVSKRRKLA
ncbi:Aste57867_6260 [Aphanomyces stellatus]|nr:hypothetical protein As57867_006246 [Aphanomyces stellatus]KAF0716495.1 hypothetical protein As57867_002815 [Aphanomyces stellatus]VFT80010.1 Aste57867_2822 [Aphanomyces stellatus]VFT83259.1 Aste57867_6260 [Aphanomyces stellatus]